MSAIRLSIFATLVAISCGGDDGLPSSWTLEGEGLRVTVHKRPYALTISDPSGHTILESLGAGAGDGYGGIGWTTGTLDMKSYISPGYTRTTTTFDPWRDGLHVVAATADATTLTVTLAGDGDERVTVTHRLRPSTLRVEASLDGDGGAAPRAWAAAFRSPDGEGFLGLGERFTRTNFRGLSMYSWLEEGGIGQNEGTPPGEMNPFPNGEPRGRDRPQDPGGARRRPLRPRQGRRGGEELDPHRLQRREPRDACLGAESRDKANIFDSPDAQAAWRVYARLHTRLQPYFMALAENAHATGAPIIRHVFLEHPDHPEWAGVDDAYYLGPSLFVAPVVARGAREKRVALPAGKWLDWDTRQVIAGGGEVTLDAPLGKLPLLLRDGGIVPLLDPRIDTLAEEDHPDVVGPSDVADVLDGVVFLSRGAARTTLAGGATLEAALDGAVAAPALPVADEAALATCDGCARLEDQGGGATRVRVSGGGAQISAGGLTLRATGVARRVRWDVVVAP